MHSGKINQIKFTSYEIFISNTKGLFTHKLIDCRIPFIGDKDLAIYQSHFLFVLSIASKKHHPL